MLQAIIFDFDGVIVDSERAHFQAFIEVFEPLGVTFDYDTYQRDLIGFDDRGAMAFLFEHDLGQPDSQERRQKISQLCQSKQDIYLRLVAEGAMEPVPGTLEFIDGLPDDFPIAIATGATRADIDAVLQALGRQDDFKVIVTADDVAFSKPDPATYVQAVEQLSGAINRELEPRDCLAIEDSSAGIDSARQAGLRTLALKTTHTSEQLSLADVVIDHLIGVSLEQIRERLFQN